MGTQHQWVYRNSFLESTSKKIPILLHIWKKGYVRVHSVFYPGGTAQVAQLVCPHSSFTVLEVMWTFFGLFVHPHCYSNSLERCCTHHLQGMGNGIRAEKFIHALPRFTVNIPQYLQSMIRAALNRFWPRSLNAASHENNFLQMESIMWRWSIFLLTPA